MKKLTKLFGKISYRILLFFDRWLITPITKLMLKITSIFKENTKGIDKLMGKKSTLIILSLILAFSIFVMIDQENMMIDQYAEILYDQPVTAIFNEELYVVEGLPETVDITLIGQRRHVFLAKQAPSRGVTVDLTGLRPGNHTVTLRHAQRLGSINYKLNPSQIMITIHEKISESRRLTYDVLQIDNLDNRLYINDVLLDRDDVIVKGAAHTLEEVATVRALINVDDITNPRIGEMELDNIPLVAYDTNGNVVDVEIVPSTVSAEISIISPSRDVPIEIIPVGDLAFGRAISSIETSVSTVTVYGQEDAVEQLTYLPVEIDVQGLTEDREFTITLRRPSGIRELSVRTITVTVTVDDTETREFSDIAVTTENLDSRFAVQALSQEDQSITALVQGSSRVLDNFDPSTLRAYIDLSGYGAGEHEVEVRVTGTDRRLTYSSRTVRVRIRIIER